MIAAIRSNGLAMLGCIGAGALVPLSLAPFNFWPSAIVAAAIFYWLLLNKTTRQQYWYSVLFGVGMFGVGTSWVFVSIWKFGGAPIAFATLLTGLFVLLLSLVFSLPFLLLNTIAKKSYFANVFCMPALWGFSEWLRTWLFTGFPWLFVGYGHLETPLAGYAPITGVMGISVAVIFTGCALGYFASQLKNVKQNPIQFTGVTVAIVLLWIGGFIANQIEWTENYQEPVTVGVAQGNIPQEKKWDDDFVEPTFERYMGLSEELWKNDWVIWPEAAIPLIYNFAYHHDQLQPQLTDIIDTALRTETTFITGILYLSPSDAKFYNSMMAQGLGAGIYHKRRLAPFGDYVPLSNYIGPVLEIFNLPHSILELGPDNQRGLQAGGALIAPAICYEIAYPNLVSEQAKKAHVIITVSNDAWFGSSIGPLQHMQMAQMRALENRRYLIRSTNNGVSAIVDDRGKILERTEQFVAQSISGTVLLKQGRTFFMNYGNATILIICTALLAAIFLMYRKQNSGIKK